MRRLSLLLCILLVACNKDIPERSPEEVLQEAFAVSQTIESVAYDIDISLQYATNDGAYDIEGPVFVEGRMLAGQHAFSASFDLSLDMLGELYTLDGAVDLILTLDAVYLRLGSLTLTPLPEFVRAGALRQLQGTWWTLLSLEQSGELTPAPTDATLYSQQLQSIRVVNDHGIQNLSGEPVYYYDIAIDTAALQEALANDASVASAVEFLSSSSVTGRVWIDAESFLVRQLFWEIHSSQDGELRLRLDIGFSDYNAAEGFAVPSDAAALPWEELQ